MSQTLSRHLSTAGLCLTSTLGETHWGGPLEEPMVLARGDCRMHLFPHKQMGLSWNPSPVHRPLSLPVHTLILLYKRRPNSFCPKNRIWKTVCLMSCLETSFTVNGLKPPLSRSPSKPTISTYLAHAIIWLDGQIFQIIQTLKSLRFPRLIISLLITAFHTVSYFCWMWEWLFL